MGGFTGRVPPQHDVLLSALSSHINLHPEEASYATVEAVLQNTYRASGAQLRVRMQEEAKRAGAPSAAEWVHARGAREKHCYERYPLACEAGIIPFGTGSDDKRRTGAELADFAFRGSLTRDMVRTLQGAAREGRKRQGTQVDEQEKEDDSAAGLRAAVLDQARNMQAVVSEVIKRDAREEVKAFKAAGGKADGRKQRQAVRAEGARCNGRRCAMRERCEGQHPNKTDKGTCATCDKKEMAVRHAEAFEMEVMAAAGSAWRWQLGRMAAERQPQPPHKIAEALMRDGRAEAAGHMPRTKPRNGSGGGAVSERADWAGRDAAESAGVRVRQTMLTGTSWTGEEQRARVGKARELCACEREDGDGGEWWCERCGKLRRLRGADGEAATVRIADGQRCGGCAQEDAERKRRTKEQATASERTRQCLACGKLACERHGGAVCMCCRTRAMIRTEGAMARWDRTASAGSGNATTQRKQRRKVKQAAQRAGALAVDCRRVPCGTSNVSGPEAEAAAQGGDAEAAARVRRARRAAHDAGQEKARAEAATAEDGMPWCVPEEQSRAMEQKWRAPAAEDDDDARVPSQQNYGGFVSIRDLKTLRPGKLGNGTVVTEFLRMAARQHGEARVHVVDSLRVGQLRTAAGGGAAALAPGRKERRAARDVSKRWWYYPVNMPEGIGHWTLMVVDRELAEATYYDSGGGDGEDEWGYIRRHVVEATEGLAEDTTWHLRRALVPTQGGVECAVRCTLHGLYAMRVGRASRTEAADTADMGREHDTRMRRFVANCIRTGRVPGVWARAGQGREGEEEGWTAGNGPAGVRNAGNTCFASVVLQGWAACGEGHAGAGGGAITTAVGEALQAIGSGGGQPVSVHEALTAVAVRYPGYAGGAQHDARAFASRVRTGMQEEGADAAQAARAVTMSTTTTCPTRWCGASSQQVTVSDGVDVGVQSTLAQALEGGARTVHGYKCEHGAHRFFATEARQEVRIAKAGRVLEIRVQRFKMGQGGRGEKEHAEMRFPLEGLEVAGNTYELRAVAVHHGATLEQGHYTAYAKREGGWYHADDGDVVRTDAATVKAQQAYMLWYCMSDAAAVTADEEAAPARASAADAGSADEAAAGGSTHGSAAGAAESRGEESKQKGVQEAEIARVLQCVRMKGGWRDVLGVDGDADGQLARRAFKETIRLVHPDKNGQSDESVEATRRLYAARTELVQEEQAWRGRKETATTAAARQKKRQRRHDAGDEPPRPAARRWAFRQAAGTSHQCPPPRVRLVPRGTLVLVRGSAEGRSRVSPIGAQGEREGWMGVAIRRQPLCGEYVVEGYDFRSWRDGFDPYVLPRDTVRVPWQVITVISAPAVGEGGEATAGWREYERRWQEEREGNGGEDMDWWDARCRANAAERARRVGRASGGGDGSEIQGGAMLLPEEAPGWAAEAAAFLDQAWQLHFGQGMPLGRPILPPGWPPGQGAAAEEGGGGAKRKAAPEASSGSDSEGDGGGSSKAGAGDDERANGRRRRAEAWDDWQRGGHTPSATPPTEDEGEAQARVVAQPAKKRRRHKGFKSGKARNKAAAGKRKR